MLSVFAISCKCSKRLISNKYFDAISVLPLNCSANDLICSLKPLDVVVNSYLCASALFFLINFSDKNTFLVLLSPDLILSDDFIISVCNSNVIGPPVNVASFLYFFSEFLIVTKIIFLPIKFSIFGDNFCNANFLASSLLLLELNNIVLLVELIK